MKAKKNVTGPQQNPKRGAGKVRNQGGKPDGDAIARSRLGSEPRRTEEALRKSGKRFRGPAELLRQPVFGTDETRTLTVANLKGLETFGYTLFHSSPVATALVRLEDNIFVDVNEAWERATGIGREKAVGRTPMELSFWANPEDRNMLIGKLRGQGVVRDFEFKVRHRSGRLSDMLLSAELIELDRVKYVLSLTQDITERKQAEETLAESEEKFRKLFEHMKSGVAVYEAADAGTDFVFKDLNTAGSLIERLPKEAVIGRKVTEVFPGIASMGLLDVMSRVWKTGMPEYLPATRYADEKYSGWRENYVYKLPRGEIVAIYEDITERKQAEKRLEYLNLTLLAIRDVNKLIVHEKDLKNLIEGICETLVKHHAYCAALIILTGEDGEPIAHTVAGAQEVFQPIVESVTRGGLPPCCEAARRNAGVFCVTADSEVCAPCPVSPGDDWRDALFIPLQHEGTTYGYLAGSVDQVARIDQEEQALFAEMAGEVAFALHTLQQERAMEKMHKEVELFETELRQAQKMEAIGALAGGIAHDFNNILTAIMGYAQLAIQNVEEYSPPYENLEGVLKASARAKDLVKQILTFSRETEQELQPVRVKPIVKETMNLLRSSLPATIKIVQNIQGEGIVRSDPTQIHQIMMNLCINAAHAMGEKGGTLQVNLKDVELDADSAPRPPDMKPGKYLLLELIDTGQGISPSTMDRIFEPFFTTKGRDEGTGMGLAVVHGVVKKMGGFIAVDSEVGKGSSFKIYMPSLTREIEPERERELPVQGGTERILFVDDEPALVDMGRQLLERLGYRVTCRTSSVEALKLFQARPHDFDLVITDLTMPKLTGDDFASKILKIRKDFPVILCTGFSSTLAEKKAREIAIRAFVMKPLVIADLARTIRQVLDAEA
jgi:PAS domain S-box-containing protein